MNRSKKLNVAVAGAEGRLGARIHLPSNVPAPTVLIITPYSTDRYHGRAQWFAEHGFAVVVCDVRGRGDSEGQFDPSGAGVGADGAAAIAWIRRQPWSDRRVVTQGGSFLGFAQWAMMKERPEGLIATAPAAAWKPGYDSPRLFGVFRMWELHWHALLSGRAMQNNLCDDLDFWRAAFLDAYRAGRGPADLAAELGDPAIRETTEAYLARPCMDEGWDALDLSAEDYTRLDLPILSITGYYDGNQWGTLYRYFEHMKHGSPEGIARHHLLLGAWDHAAATGREKRDIAGYRIGDAGAIAHNPLLLQWYRWALGEGPKPLFLDKRVGYYVTGEEAWRWADCYEEISDRDLILYLGSDDDAGDLFASGRLTADPPVQAGSDGFLCDPDDRRPGEAECPEADDDLVSPRRSRLWGDGVVYHSAPLDEPVTVAGIARLSLWIECDAPDADLQFLLIEVAPDGELLLLSETILRLRWRDSLYTQRLWPVGEVERVEVDRFLFFARRLEAGSRVRLIVRALNSIVFERNRNSGAAVGFESPDTARVARMRVHHGGARASHLRLPLAR